MTRLYLIRHGHVDAQHLFYGHLDLPLSDLGRKQIEWTAHTLAKIDIAAVYCSDLLRATQSAQLIALPHALEPIQNPAFREMNLGVLEGLTFSEAQNRYPDLAQKKYQDMWSYRFPEGENLLDIEYRAIPALKKILNQHPQGTIVLVAHNSVNRIVLGKALGLPLDKVFDFSQSFGCINCIDYREKPRVVLMNWTAAAPL